MIPGGRIGGWVVLATSVVSAFALAGLLMAYMSRREKVDKALAAVGELGNRFGFIGG